MASRLKSLVLAGFCAASMTGSVFAQVTSQPDLSGINTGCFGVMASVDLCAGAADAFALSVAPLPPIDADQEMVEAALVIAEAILAGECVINNPIPEAGLEALASSITDPLISAQVLELAEVVANCSEIPVAAIGVPTLASPE